MGGSAYQLGPLRVCLHRDEHACTLYARGKCRYTMSIPHIPFNFGHAHPLSTSLFVKHHKQQSRGELSRHTWHRQESDESSDSIPDEVRSEPNPHSRNFPRSHTFPTTVPSPSTIPTSASATGSSALGQEGAASQSGSQRRFSGPTTGILMLLFTLSSLLQ